MKQTSHFQKMAWRGIAGSTLVVSMLLAGCQTIPEPVQQAPAKTTPDPTPKVEDEASAIETTIPDYHCSIAAELTEDEMGNGFAEAPGFSTYTSVSLSAQRLDDARMLLTRDQQQALRRVLNTAIRTEWRERFAWLKPESPTSGHQLTLSYWVSAEQVPQEPQPVLQLSAELQDAANGRLLFATCKQPLFIDAKFAGAAGSELWLQGVKDAAARWASDVGNHIAAH